MNYRNPISRYLLRRHLLSRIKMRFSSEIRKLTKNEFDDLRFLYSILDEEPDCIFDGGANIGLVSYEFAKRFPHASIHAFEPNPDVFQQMKRLLHDKSRILVKNIGLAELPGVLEFRNNANTGTSSFRDPNSFHPFARSINVISVPVISIEAYGLEAGIRQINILKLDIEGFELEALKGSGSFMEEGKIDFILCEVNLVPTYDFQPCIEEIVAYCRDRGFHPYNFYGINESKNREGILTNVLFISNSFAERLNDKLGKNSVFTSGGIRSFCTSYT